MNPDHEHNTDPHLPSKTQSWLLAAVCSLGLATASSLSAEELAATQDSASSATIGTGIRSVKNWVHWFSQELAEFQNADDQGHPSCQSCPSWKLCKLNTSIQTAVYVSALEDSVCLEGYVQDHCFLPADRYELIRLNLPPPTRRHS